VSPLLIGLLAGAALVSAMWLYALLLPSQWRAIRFLYDVGDSPAVTNNGFPHDDAPAVYAGDPDPWPDVLIIAPGRNEGHLLEKTIGSLCAMTYPRFRVVFVDDQSTDNTREVCEKLAARFPHFSVIHNTTPPPPGWIGKTWAVAQAEPLTQSAEWILFTDSDLEYHPECLTQAVRLQHHRNADLVSFLPALKFETLGELLGLLPAMTLICIKIPLAAANDPADSRALIAGGFFLIRGELYRHLRGHSGVRGQVIEDIAFGQRAKAAGKRVFTAATHSLFSARMYEGWADTYNGLKKNAYAGANYRPLAILPITFFLLFIGALVPAYALAAAIACILHPTPVTIALLAVTLTGFAAQLAVGIRSAWFLSLRPLTAFALAPGFAFYALIFLASVLDHYRGGNTWAGRRMAPKNVRSLAQTDRDG
jgi:glycosyltransferase involved in cell wall biosynthesis